MELAIKSFNQKLEQLLDISVQHGFKREQKMLQELQQDVMSNEYIIVVIGEFNHGKSSFVNAILGEALLPTGIIPTTATINALYYAQEPQTHICYKGQEEQPLRYSNETLQAYIADHIDEAANIDYIRIGVANELLKDNVLLIDTPGLNDVNELRSNITYSFVPRADVVFFMLQMHKPLNRTEVEFLTNGLLRHGIDRIVFIANFVDQIDEEQIDEALVILTGRLKAALGVEDVTVFAISAKEGLEAKQTNDAELLALSGIVEVEQKMQQMCTSGTRQQEKNTRLNRRLQQLQQQVVDQLAQIHDLFTADANELEAKLQTIQEWKASEQARKNQLNGYIEEQQHTILMMLHKSLDFFFTTLQRKVEERIDMQTTGNIEVFFQKDIPLFVKYQLKGWVESYTPQLQTLFLKLEQQLSKALTEAYEEVFHIGQSKERLEFDETIMLDFKRELDPTLKSGLVVAGASSVMLLAAPILVPFVAVFGMPFLTKKLQEKQMEEKKPVLKAETIHQLQEMRKAFTFKMEQYVRTSIMQVADETYRMVEQQQSQVFAQIEQLQQAELQDVQLVQQKITQLEQLLEQLGGKKHVESL